MRKERERGSRGRKGKRDETLLKARGQQRHSLWNQLPRAALQKSPGPKPWPAATYNLRLQLSELVSPQKGKAHSLPLLMRAEAGGPNRMWYFRINPTVKIKRTRKE